VAQGKVRRQVWEPATFGVARASMEDLKGGDAVLNASITRAILEGERGPKRDVVIANAAAGLVAAGLAENLGSGVVTAAESIDSGSAWAKLQQLKERCGA
ncbi:MAG: anthranilate phosphoribosyltransferase, partial [Acidobacteriota bacterium]|jgi:anthranilate phosphoribosyltransferase